MALTEDERYEVIHYLGYPSRTITEGTSDYQSVIADNLSNLSPQGERYIRETLADLASLKESLAATRRRMLVRKVGDIELNENEWSLLQKEYSRVLNELSRATEIELRAGRSATIRIVV